MRNESNKILFLQGLKGIMAIVVVVYHYLQAFFPSLVYGDDTKLAYDKISKSFLNIFYDGNLAVLFFFLIGAYIISYKVFGKNIFININFLIKSILDF